MENELRGGMTEDQLIDRVFGNIHVEYPEITREKVIERLQKKGLVGESYVIDLSDLTVDMAEYIDAKPFENATYDGKSAAQIAYEADCEYNGWTPNWSSLVDGGYGQTYWKTVTDAVRAPLMAEIEKLKSQLEDNREWLDHPSVEGFWLADERNGHLPFISRVDMDLNGLTWTDRHHCTDLINETGTHCKWKLLQSDS